MVCAVWASHLVKLLKVIRRKSCLTFKITLGGGNELIVRVTGVLAIIIFTTNSGDRDSLGPPPFPPFIVFDALLCSLVIGCSWRSPTAARGHLFAVLHEDSPDLFLTRGVLGGDVEELLHGRRLFMTELMHQGSVGHSS
jgi:hypothetical protein